MKTRIFKYIAVVALLFMAVPMQGQNYLKLWFKDGRTERHFMHLVKSISATKYDLEGNLHSDYQMQQIIMEDTTYSYYIADIDSMSFKKVDEEQVKADVVAATTAIEPIFEQCSSVEDMEQQLDKIRNLESVEDAYISGSDLFVRIRDWRTISYHFHNSDSMDNDSFSSLAKKKSPQHKADIPFNQYNAVKVAIINQTTRNENPWYAHVRERSSYLKRDCDTVGFDAIVIDTNGSSDISPTLDFFENDIFRYNLIYLVTHGSYDSKNHLHWLTTGEEISDEDIQLLNKSNWNTKYDDNMVSIAFIPETRSGVSKTIHYYKVSEDFIRKAPHSFSSDYHPSIFYNAACESLEGVEVLSRYYNGKKESYYGSRSLADVFIAKGSDIYMGFNKTAYHSAKAGYTFYHDMLNGLSEEAALRRLPILWKDETDARNAALIDVFAPNVSGDNFLIKMHTIELTPQDVENMLTANDKVKLIGLTSVCNLEESKAHIDFGFRYGTSSSLTGDNFEIEGSSYIETDNYGGNLLFTAEIDLSKFDSGKRIYYQAYTFDGLHYNLGDICSFDIPEHSTPSDGEESFTVNGVTFKMVNVEGGTFWMGANDDDSQAYGYERPRHQVTLSSYSIGQTEVTQELWAAVMGSNPSEFKGTSLPVEMVSWNDCQEFLRKLESLTGKAFRLPTEAEWEFAARGGNLSKGYNYSGSNVIGDVAWYFNNSWDVGSSSPDYGTHAVGTKSPNELGIYDMSGNVWEWCQDLFDYYSSDAQTNPVGASTGSYRISRGGSWTTYAMSCRVCRRVYCHPTYYNGSSGGSIGLRLAL